MGVGECRVRVTGGTLSGRTIRTPGGTSTRPTADRVREAVFSRIDARLDGCLGAVVLDAFSGSGALGIEALSRGAAEAVFVERTSAAFAAIRGNVASLSLESRSRVLRGDVFTLARGDRLGAAPFTLLFLDPPYRINKSEVRVLIETLRQHGRLGADAIAVWEYDSGAMADWPVGFESLGPKRYGATEVDVAVLNSSGEAS